MFYFYRDQLIKKIYENKVNTIWKDSKHILSKKNPIITLEIKKFTHFLDK